MNGLVRRFNHYRGYGFIEALTGHPGSNPEFFFHASACRGGIAPPIGAEVRFRVVRGEKGPQAAAVEVVGVRARQNGAGS